MNSQIYINPYTVRTKLVSARVSLAKQFDVIIEKELEELIEENSNFFRRIFWPYTREQAIKDFTGSHDETFLKNCHRSQNDYLDTLEAMVNATISESKDFLLGSSDAWILTT